MKITGNTIKGLGFKQGKVIGLVLKITKEHQQTEEILTQLKAVLQKPEAFLEHELFSEIASTLIEDRQRTEIIPLRENSLPFSVYGKNGIEEGTFQQMQLAMQLPIARAGALMPDAHRGYGLPIGGVLATENSVIPYAVGVDIGCRMYLSIFNLPENTANETDYLKDVLMQNTRFGKESFRTPIDHEIMEHKTFRELQIAKKLKDRAYEQLGTSGSGNHFVEFGVAEITSQQLGVPKGKHLALLSHSGSRGFGALLAKHYTQLAIKKCKLPEKAKHLAWFDMQSNEGQEYWAVMNLANKYSLANHELIHQRIERQLNCKAIVQIENTHNIAMCEIVNGEEMIVHRKGATPEQKGKLGIIPGSMATSGFIVQGKGNPLSLQSASHGAGRLFSRKKAEETLTQSDMDAFLNEAGVTIIGSGINEAPMAYKNIHEVMAQQTDLVDILGTFTPKIVRMH